MKKSKRILSKRRAWIPKDQKARPESQWTVGEKTEIMSAMHDQIEDPDGPREALPLEERRVILLWSKLSPTYRTTEALARAVAKQTGLPLLRVKKIAEKAQAQELARSLNRDISLALFADKVPALRQTIGLTLEIINQRLQSMLSNEEEIKSFGPKELVQIASLLKSTNEILRLESGQSTQNVAIAHSYEAARAALNQLRPKDPIFDYPQLPDANGSESSEPNGT